MEIKQLKDQNIKDVVKLWNKEVVGKTIYKPLTEEIFKIKFINTANSYNVVLMNKDEVIGFGNSVFKDQEPTSSGFITCVVVKAAYQRQGYGSKILVALEEYLKKNHKTYIRQLFLNPILLEWYIPNTNNHDHPGAPAIEYNSPFYLFLLANGYNVSGSQQDVFYLNLLNYEVPEKIKQMNSSNEEKGYYIKTYDKDKHQGFKKLFEALRNPTWHQVVKNNLAKDKPNKMLVVVKNDLILGWTGPLYTTESKRGYFGGIGIHPDAQGLGLGSTLFSELINQSKLNGAVFMSLFTGSENPARKIYLKAGFKIVKSFAILRKEL